MKASGSLVLLAAATLVVAYPRTLLADKTDNQYRHAREAFYNGDVDNAALELEQILSRNPDYENARILLGLIHSQRGQEAERKGERTGAVAELRQALLLAPDEAYWHSALAKLLDQQGDAAEAVKECQQAAQLSPDDWGLASGCGLNASEHPEKKPDQDQKNGGAAPVELTKIGGEVSAPRPIYKPEPPYSERARLAKFQGATVLSIVINALGSVERPQVERALGLGLDQEALRTICTWTFQPALRKGVPVPVRVKVQISFRLF
jgi:TonB family protein